MANAQATMLDGRCLHPGPGIGRSRLIPVPCADVASPPQLSTLQVSCGQRCADALLAMPQKSAASSCTRKGTNAHNHCVRRAAVHSVKSASSAARTCAAKVLVLCARMWPDSRVRLPGRWQTTRRNALCLQGAQGARSRWAWRPRRARRRYAGRGQASTQPLARPGHGT